MKRKLVAILACRNKSSRMYAKPLQNIDIKKNLKIIDFLVNKLKNHKTINEVALAISKEPENLIYKKIAKNHSLKFVFGDDHDVLSRLIKCAKKTKATDILRITSESPFPYLNNLHTLWNKHVKNNFDGTFLDNIVDGCGYEIINISALIKSHKLGSVKHRSELCTLYMRENIKEFKILKFFPHKKLFRTDIRLTVDNPEDLMLCRIVYEKFKNRTENLQEIIKLIDKRPQLKKIIKPYCSLGYSSMYK